MREKLVRLPRELGPLGLASFLALLALGIFHFSVMGPLEMRRVELQERVERQPPPGPAQLASSAPDKVAAVYAFLRRDEETSDWLAKLHGIGTATGVQLKSASYRTQAAEGRIVRYEIVLPVAGSYPQIREFLKRSLAEIPVLSLDQISLKRETRNDGAVQAELRLTLHMVKS
jgi:Type II secretion system (T2SS), protein M subtype b